MVRRMTLLLTLFLAGACLLGGSLIWAAEGVISKVANPTGTSCNLKFPAIREENRWRVKGLSISTSCALQRKSRLTMALADL